MEPAEIHILLTQTLGAGEAVSFDEIVLAPPLGAVPARELLDWLAWAKRGGCIEDIRGADGRRRYRLLPLRSGADVRSQRR